MNVFTSVASPLRRRRSQRALQLRDWNGFVTSRVMNACYLRQTSTTPRLLTLLA
jgi:hypothetical protein